jgi:hypothetical protein
VFFGTVRYLHLSLAFVGGVESLLVLECVVRSLHCLHIMDFDGSLSIKSVNEAKKVL